MNATDTLLRQAAAEGVAICVTSDGAVKVKGTRHAVDHWLPIVRERKSAIVAALAADAGRRWLVRFSGGEPFELVCQQPLTVDDVRRLYSTAVSIEPAPIVLRRSATAAEARELKALIGTVLPGDVPEERAEALAVALEDPEPTLVCFRLLATSSTIRHHG